MPAETSIANVDLVIGIRVPVRVMPIRREITFETREVCAIDGQPLDYDQRCGTCQQRVTAPVIGTPARRPVKQRFCTNQSCGAKLEGAVSSDPYCSGCRRLLKEEEVADAYPFAGQLLTLSDKERKGLLRLREERQVRVLRILNIRQQPSPRYYRGPVMQLLPNVAKDKRAALVFEALRVEACQQQLTFAAYSVLRHEEKHLTFVHEHGALVRCEPDGAVLLIPLLGEHEVDVMPMPTYVPEESQRGNLIEMRKVVPRIYKALSLRGRDANQREMLSTSGVRALHKLLAAKAMNTTCSLAEPEPEDRNLAKLVRQLENAMPAAEERAPRRKQAASA